MAEIIGLASGIIAIAGAARTALKISRSMRKLARDLRAVKKDIKRFARDIEAFSSIIGAAHYALETHSKAPQSQSKVLIFIHERNLLDHLVDQSENVIDHIKQLRPGIESLKNNIPLIERLKWIFRRKDVIALGPKMESVKTSLNLVITILTFEALMQSIKNGVVSQDSTHLAVREMRRLKRDMKLFMDRMGELQEQQQQHPPLQIWESPENTFVDVQMDIQEALLELGESIVANDTIPDVELSSTSSRTLGTNNDPYVVPVAIPRRHTPVSSSRPLRHRRSPIMSQTIPPAAERAITPVRIETFRHQEADEDLSGEESDGSDSLEVGEIRTVTSDSDPGEGPSRLIVEEHRQSSISDSTYEDGDFISVHKTSSHIYFNPNNPREIISGYVATDKGAVQITASLDRELPENIISLALVADLGLKIHDSDEGKKLKCIHIGTRPREKSRGRVELQWSQEAFLGFLGHAPFKVHCWVYEENQIRALVFGEPFVNKRRHYSTVTEIED